MSALVARDVDSGIISPWETKGGSLANFSLTCKRVRALCCPHLFSYVTAISGIKREFRRRIAISLSPHLRRLELQSTDELLGTSEEYADFLVAVSTLPSLESLKINSNHLDRLFLESDNGLDFEQSLAEDSDTSFAFRLVLNRITQLGLEDVGGSQVATILSRTNERLTSLRLSTCGEDVAKDTLDARHLQNSLTRFSNLERMTIQDSNNIFEVFPIPQTAIWPLRSLTLYHLDFHPAHLELIACCSPTLELLSYDTDYDHSNSTTAPPLLTGPFPRLKSVKVGESSKLYMATDPAWTPSLLSLTISTSASLFPSVVASLPAHLSRMPRLQSLSIGVTAKERMPRRPREVLAQALSETKIKLHFTTPQDLLLAGGEEILERGESVEQTPVKEYIGRRKEEVKEVLDFGTKYQEQLVETGDTVGMDRLVEALRPLKMLQDFQEDD